MTNIIIIFIIIIFVTILYLGHTPKFAQLPIIPFPKYFYSSRNP